MRYVTCAVLLLTSLPGLARADEALSPQMVTALKAATVFVKIRSGDMAGSGSGFVIRAEGDTAYIVTNRHVVEPPKVAQIVVVPERRSGGSRYGSGRHRGVPGFPQPIMPSPMVPPRVPLPGEREERPRYSARVVIREFKNVEVTVVFQSGTAHEDSVPGKLVAVDPDEDLAIIKVSGVKQPPGTIDYRHEPQLAETMPVYVFGFPLGEKLSTSKRSPAITVGRGTVSSLRTDDDGNLSVVQLDAALNHGNSGGPVVDARGRLVGVAVARITEEGVQNLGLAIPSRAVSRLLHGRLDKAVLTAVKDGDDRMLIKVSAALIDPLNKIKSARLHYLSATAVADKSKPSDPLEALPGCRTLELKLEDGVASGTISLRKGVTEVSLLHQAVSIDESGKRAVSDSAVNRVALAPLPPTLPPSAAPPAAVVTGQKSPSMGPASQGSAVVRPGPRHGFRPAVQAGNPAIRAGEPEQIFGGRFGPQFRDLAPANGLLVGFEVGLGKWASNDVVSSLRPIYLDGQGKEVLGEQHGVVNGQAIRVRAKPGYAVGAITAKSLAAIDGFSLTFMKIDKERLDPADKYESDWLGGKGGTPETTAGGNGSPAIGIVGHCNDKDCTAVGLVFAPAKAGE